MDNPLSLFSLILATLRHRRAVSVAVGLGVATATAVITGALLVGDSMRGSLRALTVERLGRIESILAPGNFFRMDALKLDDEAAGNAVYVILLPGGAAETQADRERGKRKQLMGGVQIVAADDTFWDLDVTGIRPTEMPGDETVVLNQTAADELGVRVGDEITVRLPVEGAVPADSPLGKREIQSEGLPRMRIADIVPDSGLGRFSLASNQAAPKTIFVSRTLIAEVLDRDGQANAALFSKPVQADAVGLSLDAMGWKLEHVQKDDAVNYISLTSESLLLPEPAVSRIVDTLPEGSVTPVMTYLANAIELADKDVRKASDEDAESEVADEVPYSTIASMDSGSTLKLEYESSNDVSGDAAADANASDRPVPMVINDWTASRLGAEVGSPLRIYFYEPEIENGREVERSFAAFVTQIVPITKPSKPYSRRDEAVFDKPVTPYNDPGLTPDVPGVTDQDSISDWDLPFQLTRTINSEDDLYWNEHRLTPKAFLPLEAGQRLFGSRFGKTTGLRIDPAKVDDLESLRKILLDSLAPIKEELGWTPHSIRNEQLAASKGTTPFDALFLALSFFVILSAMMLIALLLRLGILQRLSEFGTLLAVGFTPRRVMTLALGETAITGWIGVAVGVLGGVGYASLVLWALRSWWVGAVTVPFLRFHASGTSLVIGAVAGWLVCMVTAAWTLRLLLRLDPASLLGGRKVFKDKQKVSQSGTGQIGHETNSRSSRLPRIIVLSLVVIALLIPVVGARAGGQQAAGAFVGAGMLLLMAALVGVHDWLGQRGRSQKSLTALSMANARRSPLRSTLTIGLVATAAFLILSMTAFQLSPTSEGTGGFDLIVEAGQPIAQDLRDPIVQKELLGRDAELLADATIVPCRMRAGDDASCNNLYQATRPTVLGVDAGESLSQFAWAASAASSATDDRSIATWDLLQGEADGSAENPIPVVIDLNTAMWSLQMTKGIGETKSFEYESGKPVTFQVVGLLNNSVLQGKLIVGTKNFEKVFPSQSGYRLFLIDAPSLSGQDDKPLEMISEALESRLVDAGVDVRRADQVLAGMLAVQNTYLRTFQSLGALGLLLGTIGLAVAQLRSVLERRNELAVMRAVGFTKGRLAKLVLGENFFLLMMGLGCGVVTAVLAVLPYAWITSASVPIAEPLWVLLGILVFGMLAGLIAVWRVVTLPLVDSLRAEHAAIEL